MVAAELVQRKIAELASALAADRASEVVATNLVRAVQIACDLAAHVIADEGWRPTATVAASFERLAEHGVLTRATASMMGRAVSTRDRLARDYPVLDPVMIYAASTTGLADLDAFAREVSAWLAAR